MSVTSAKDRSYSVVPYQTTWKERYEDVRSKLMSVFGTSAVSIEHVGSTSVEGMAGKPTIDVLVTMDDIARADATADNMAAAGYAALGQYVSEGGRLFALEKEGHRTVNVHCFPESHPHAREMLVMRDFLRRYPEEAATYATLKQDLYARFPTDYVAYRRLKDPYLRELCTRAEAWQASMYHDSV